MSDFGVMLFHPAPGMMAWPAAMIVWGPSFTARAHRHHCVQLVMALRGSLLVRGGSRELGESVERCWCGPMRFMKSTRVAAPF